MGVGGAVLPVLTVFLSDDLTTDGLSVSARTGDGLVLTVALLVGLALAAVVVRALDRAGERLRLGATGARRAQRAALAAVAVAFVLLLGGLALSDRGIGGTISDQADSFTEPKLDRQNDPARVLRTNSGNRWVWWEEAADGFADRPVTGYGAGSFPITHRRYRENRLEVLQPHSVPLEFLTETGLVGALLALGGLALLVLAAHPRRARAGARAGARLRLRPAGGRVRVVVAHLGRLGLGDTRRDAGGADRARRAGGRAAAVAATAAVASRAAAGCGWRWAPRRRSRWSRWRRCPRWPRACPAKR